MQKTIFILIIILIYYNVNAQFRIENAYPNLTFLQPLDFQMPDDGTNRTFIVTQEGVIYVFPNDSTATTKKVFLDIKSKIRAGGELGLLGLTFHPDYKNNGYFYVNYTADNPLRTIIARYSVDNSNPDIADEESELIILEVGQPYSNHNAGQIAFGPDGYFYFGLGDGGSGGDPQNNGQNRKTLLGSLPRIDVNNTSGDKNYAIPADNPFVNNTESIREEIWAYGLRNPWRFSFDPETNLIWTGDVGQNRWEEIDIIEKGKNYGWRIMEGFHCYNPSSNCDTTGLTLPIWEYGHNDSGGISITGGFVYRGGKFPELYGKYLYADFGTGRIWALEFQDKKALSNNLLYHSGKNISSFGIDANKEIYICSFDGRIYKITYDEPTLIPGSKPDKYGLLYNFPNPFNPKTTIVANIKGKSEVILEIFNIKGEVLEILVDETLEKGSYKYEWEAVGYSSGVYICRLTAKALNNLENYSLVRKMILLK